MRENIEIITSRIISIWMVAMISILFLTTSKNTFKIGPNPDLFILFIPINTTYKYSMVVSFCFCNSILRSLNHNILQSYIINSIQDIQDNLSIIPSIKAYEISCVSTIYNWFDFFMYMHILMSQIDLLLVEVSADIIMTIIITNYYLDKKHNYVPINI